MVKISREPDHGATITDLRFSENDERLYTSSVDGSVYEWNVSESTCTRIGDYIWKGACATKVASTMALTHNKTGPKVVKTSHILAVFEMDNSITRKEMKSKLGRNSSFGKSRGSMSAASFRRRTTTIEEDSPRVGGKSAASFSGMAKAAGLGIKGFKSMGMMKSSLAKTSSQVPVRRPGTNTPLFGGGPRQSTGDGASVSASPVLSRANSAKKTAEFNGCYIAQWENHVSANVTLIEVDAKITSIAVGRIGSPDSLNIAVIGCADGRVIIGNFPLATLSMVIGTATGNINSNSLFSSGGDNDTGMLVPAASPLPNNGSVVTNTDGSKSKVVLNMSACKTFLNHHSKVTSVNVSPSGLWIFTCGEEGSIYMLATNSKAGLIFMQDENKKSNGYGQTTSSAVATKSDATGQGDKALTFIDNIPEALASENTLVMTDRSVLLTQSSCIEELKLNIDDTRASNVRAMNQLTEKKDHIIAELEATLKREIEKRDAIIMNGRDEHARHAKSLHEKLHRQAKDADIEGRELEVGYEKRLAKEQLAYQELKQYLDEFACHARMDVDEAKSQVAEREVAIIKQQNVLLGDSEKQKATMLMYVDYVKERYMEIIDSMEKAQEDERRKLKGDITAKGVMVEDAVTRGRTEVNTLRRNITLLKTEMNDKDMQLLTMQGDLEWARNRISVLETSLNQASNELKLRIDTAERWEFKSGDQQQQILELERIRKALTSQLHSLRQDLVPKEEKILHLTDQLTEIDREYESSLTAVSDKEMLLKKKSTKLHVLQKQVSQLRYALSRKDGSLHRAAKLFEEYKLSIQRARFDSIKQPAVTDSKSAAAMMTNELSRANLVSNKTANPNADTTNSNNAALMMMNNNSNSNDGGNNSNKDSLPANALAQIIGGADSEGSTKKSRKTKEGIVEIVVFNDTMERAWKRLGDILNPYVAAPAGYSNLEEDTVSVDRVVVLYIALNNHIYFNVCRELITTRAN